MSKQAEVSKKRRLICLDADVLDLLRGGNSDYVAETGAKIFEWFFLFFFGEKSLSKENGFVSGGRRWAKFDYDNLLNEVNKYGVRVNNRKALVTAVKALEDAGLLIAILSVNFPGDGKSNGKYYAMRFDKMPQPVRAGYKDHFHFRKHRAQYGLDKWDEAWDVGEVDTLSNPLRPADTSPKHRGGNITSGAGATPPPDKGEDEQPLPSEETPYPERSGGTDDPTLRGQGVGDIETASDGVNTERKRLSDVKISGLPPTLRGRGGRPVRVGLYIRNIEEGFIEEEKDSTVSDETVGDAHLDEDDFQIDEPKTVFAAMARTAYRGLVCDEAMKKTVLAAIGKVQNAKVRTGNGSGTVVLDVETVEDYAIWRVLLQWKWHGRFPTIGNLENELRYEFLPWYASETHRNSLQNFKQRYPDWRQRLFVGDYVAFHQEVQDDMQKLRQANSKPRSNGALQRRPVKLASYGPELDALIAEQGLDAPLSDEELDARGIF